MPIQKEAVYRIDPKSGKVSKAPMKYSPNGLCFSPDYSKLAVDTGASTIRGTQEIKVWNALQEHPCGGKTFASMKLETKARFWGGADGIRCDKDETFGRALVGRVMVLTVCMFSNQGKASGSDKFVAEICSNLCFGGIKQSFVHDRKPIGLFPSPKPGSDHC